MKHTYLFILLSLFGLKLSAQDIIISGVYDAQGVSALSARGVELYVCNNIADLSVYGLGSANNGGGTDSQEFTFPVASATAGQFIYVAADALKFSDFFGFAADYTDTDLSITGNDAIELFLSGNVIDVFGEVTFPGSGHAWNHSDGWAYRVDATPANNGTWAEAAFTYSGINTLEGATNSVAATPFPLGTYAKVASTDPILSFDIASQLVEENVGSVTVDINILQENTNPTTVDVILGLSTADGSDFTFTDPTTITFPASSAVSQQLIIPIIDDLDPEGMEDIVIMLSNAGNNAEISLTENTHTITINVSDAPAPTTDIVISEIMYNPPETGTDSLEFFELYNNGSTAIDLEGWSFSAGVDYTFTGVTMNPGDFVIVTENAQALENNYGYVGAHQWVGSLTNGGEAIVLIDAFGQIADSVDYEDDTQGWDANADGTGSSLILCDPNSDNNDPANWEAAHFSVGNGQLINGMELTATPGALGGCAPIITDPIVSFDTTSTTVDEDAGTVTIDLTIVNENASPTSADVVVGVASTATNVSDFTYTTTTVTFPASSNAMQQISVDIIDDLDPEMLETIVFEITNITNAGVAGSNDSHTVNINISDAPAAPTDVYITEIMYNPPEAGTDSLEYIEVHNNGLVGEDMTGWSFSTGVVYDFPSGILPAGSSIVVAKNAGAIDNNFSVTGTEQWTSGTLSNTGEILTIVDGFGSVIDSVRYDDGSDWDTTMNTLSDGGGSSLVYCGPDNDLGTSWEVCHPDFTTGNIINTFELIGTPGQQKGCDAIPVNVNEEENVIFSIYPNPVMDGQLNINVKQGGLVTIFNLVGKVLLNKEVNANQTEINVSDYSAGVYLVKFNQNGNTVTKRLVIR